MRYVALVSVLTLGLGLEIVALERVAGDGPWPGSRTRLVDDLNLGKYLFDRDLVAVFLPRALGTER